MDTLRPTSRLTFDVMMRPRRTDTFHRVMGGYSRADYYRHYRNAAQQHDLRVRLVTRNRHGIVMQRECGSSVWVTQ